MIQLSPYSFFFFFNDTATTEIYTLSLHDALPILVQTSCFFPRASWRMAASMVRLFVRYVVPAFLRLGTAATTARPPPINIAIRRFVATSVTVKARNRGKRRGLST